MGVVILLLPGTRSDDASLGGMLLLLIAAVLWATGSFLSRKVPLPKDAFISTAVQQITGGGVIILISLVTGETSDLDLPSVSSESVFGFLYLVVFGSLLAFTAYTWLLQNAPIQKVATYAYVNPVVAMILGWLILGEQITNPILIGAVVIVASVAFIVRREASPGDEGVSSQEREPAQPTSALRGYTSPTVSLSTVATPTWNSFNR